MIKRRVWRYTCEHCGKSGCSAGHMKRHERGCTKNPARVCGMCLAAEQTQPAIAELVKIASEISVELDVGYDSEKVINVLRTAANGCPACMLAAMRQADVWPLVFIFSEEQAAFWKRINENRPDPFYPIA